MYAERHVVALLTAADGSMTAYSPAMTGRILSVRYMKTDFTDGVDLTITADATGEAILTLTNVNASGSFYPRAAVHDAAGTAGTLLEPVVLARDRLKIVVAAGGNAKTGAVHIVVG